MAGTNRGDALEEGLAGDLSLGIKRDETFDFVPVEWSKERLEWETLNQQTLLSIDQSLKTLLSYLESISS